jgi:hypothetical protein
VRREASESNAPEELADKNIGITAMRNVTDRLCGLVVRVIGYRSGGPGSIPGITRKKM